MKKVAVVLLLVLATAVAAGQGAPSLGLAGVYRVDINAGQVWLTVKILPGAPTAQFVGVVLDSNVEWGRQQIGQGFLELNTGADGKYVGRFRPQFTGNSNNLNEWWPLENGWLDEQGNLTFVDVTAAGRGVHTFWRIHFDQPLRGGGEPAIAGQYRWDSGSDYAILDVRAGGLPLYELVGVLVDGSAGYRRYIGDTFFQLNKVGINGYQGWDKAVGYRHPVERGGVTESGDLRLEINTPQGHAVILYKKYRGGAPAAAAPQPTSGSGAGAGGGGTPRAAGGSSPAPVRIASTTSAWQQAQSYVGGISNAQQGLLLQGGPFTNGRLVNGAYDGNRVQSREVIDLSAGGDIFAAFAVNGAGAYLVFWPRLLTGISAPALTTDHSWNNSILVPHLTWLFGHLRVNPGGGYQLTISTGSYDTQGGTPIYRGGGTLANPVGRVDFQFMDNYAGVNASMMIGEVWVVHDGGGAPGGQVSQPGPQALPGGAQCSAPGQCDSGICLLGVCAPKSR